MAEPCRRVASLLDRDTHPDINAAAAGPAEILLSQRLNAAVEGSVATDALQDLALKGFSKPVAAFRVLA